MILKSILRQVDNAKCKIETLLRNRLGILRRRTASPSNNSRTSGSPSSSFVHSTPVSARPYQKPAPEILDLCDSPPSTPVSGGSSKKPVPETFEYVDLCSPPEQQHVAAATSTVTHQVPLFPQSSSDDVNSMPPQQQHLQPSQQPPILGKGNDPPLLYPNPNRLIVP